MVGSRGFEPRSARSERAASANCATSRDGPSGWTRTTTTRVKSPGCCVDTTEGVERMTGFEPVPYPTFALDRPTGIEPVPPRWQRGMRPPHSGRTRTGVVHRPIDIRQFSKTPLFRAGGRRRTIRSVPPIWRQRQESNPDPRALEARMLPLHHAAYVTSRLDGLDRRKRHTLPLAWPVSVHGREAKTKKAF